jgi:hypothetical protein
MPNRILRDGINSSARVNALSLGAEVFYRRLMSVVDDFGRYHGSVVTLRGACWPTNPDKIREKDLSKWLNEVLKGDEPLVKTYNVSGAVYVEIQDFGQPTRSKSRFPDPPWAQVADGLHADCAQDESKPSAGCSQNDSPLRMRIRMRSANTGGVHETGTTEPSEFERVLEQAAQRMHDQHPQHRRCSVPMVKQKLRAIAKRSPVPDRVARISEIEQRHSGWCGYWGREPGSPFAKALENWLAPTMGRFDEEPPASVPQPPASPPRLML